MLAVPLLWIGIGQLEPAPSARAGPPRFETPLLVDLLAPYANPQFAEESNGAVALADLNPLYMAGWVGLLITGLNMMPVSQLDGGHVVYALFRERAHTIAGAFVIVAIGYIVLNDYYTWTVMLLLVILMGIHHPPTRDDRVKLGPVRWAVGLASLSIPFLCFPPRGILWD